VNSAASVVLVRPFTKACFRQINSTFTQHGGETQMITEPKLEDRNAQPYVGIRTQVPMKEFKRVVPQLLGEIFAWLEKQGVAPAGAPFMRFHVINMATSLTQWTSRSRRNGKQRSRFGWPMINRSKRVSY
jgi:hypothetical protein